MDKEQLQLIWDIDSFAMAVSAMEKNSLPYRNAKAMEIKTLLELELARLRNQLKDSQK